MFFCIHVYSEALGHNGHMYTCMHAWGDVSIHGYTQSQPRGFPTFFYLPISFPATKRFFYFDYSVFFVHYTIPLSIFAFCFAQGFIPPKSERAKSHIIL